MTQLLQFRNQKSEIIISSSAMFPCRLLIDPPAGGAWNMAVDEILLEDAALRNIATLRFYEWQEPTLSLGYFQKYEQRFTHAASAGAPAVRRLSGGGALVHHRELTYSLALPRSHRLSASPARLYAIVHVSIIAALSEFGIAVFRRSESPCGSPPTGGAGEPFLCFCRHMPADVVALAPGASTEAAKSAPAKIVGSAQRRRRGAILQHGAILLAASPCAPELPGIAEIMGISPSAAALIEPIRRCLSASAGLAVSPWTLEDAARQNAAQLVARRYGEAPWTRRR